MVHGIRNGIESEQSFTTERKQNNEVDEISTTRTQTEKENEVGKQTDLLQMPEVEYSRFFKIIDSSIQGLREYRLITTALDLEVFEALKDPLPAYALAEKLGCDPLLMPYFCEALYRIGLLDRFEEGTSENLESKEAKIELQNQDKDQIDSRVESKAQSINNQGKTGDHKYLISELTATYLLKNSPFPQKHYLAERLRNVELWTRLPQIMREGPEIFDKGPFFGEVIQCMAESAKCGTLQETIRVVLENVDFTKIRKMLDLGGGHGLYAIAFAKQNRDLKVFVFDLPPVTEKTKQFIEKYDASNVNVIPGDFFKDEIGKNYDLIFSSFNPGGKVPSLVPKITEALNPGGIFITRQVPEEKMESNPLFNLDWNLWTFEDVKKGSTSYTFENSVPFSEYIEMLENYGLKVLNVLDMKDGSKTVFAQKMT
ncbi:MAG: methyltransferase [Methanosarcina sp.]